MKREKTEIAYIYNAVIIVLPLFIGILVMALLSYNPHDHSWFYYTSSHSSLHNVLNIYGAYIASLFFYLFGNAVVIMLFTAIYAWYLMVMHSIYWHDVDRIIALCCMPLAWSLYFGISTSNQAGGLIGFIVSSYLYQWFDDTSLMLSTIILMMVSMVLSMRPPMLFIMRLLVNVWYIMPWMRSIFSWVYNGVYRLLIQCCHVVEQFFRIIDILMADTSHEKMLLIEYQDRASNEEIALSMVQQDDVYDEHTSSYRLPSASLFTLSDEDQDGKTIILRDELIKRARLLEEKLNHFDIHGRVVASKQGPVVTLYEYQPEIDSKISKIIALEDDLALALQALSIRIIAPIPGRSVVGFEVANTQRTTVYISTILKSAEFTTFSGSLPAILGYNSRGEMVIADIATMPHLLIAGSTGSGKSVALHALLVSLLCKCTPDELRLILIDPKRLELAVYADIAHLLFPIVIDPAKVPEILTWVVGEMERRYVLIAQEGVRTSDDYNKRVAQNNRLPRIVIIIDELADLMMTSGRDVETLIARIAQMARAAGIHLIVATQRPSVDVITGLIKVNFPSRIAFRVTSKIDSRVILDCNGADKLLGRGDMLFLDAHHACLKRVHGAYVSDREIHDLVAHIKAERAVEYVSLPPPGASADAALYGADQHLYTEVLAYLQEIDEVSISLLQRKFRIGYNRSARIIDTLEEQGKVMTIDGSKTRRVIR